MKNKEQKIEQHLNFLYSDEESSEAIRRIMRIIEEFRNQNLERYDKDRTESYFSEQDAILITYGDQIQETGEAPLNTLKGFLNHTIKDEISILHLLPFFPYSSDDGFSITDYRSVNDQLGDWGNIKSLGHEFDLMFDAVINHVSRESKWFRRFLQGDPEYQDYFIEVDDSWDLSEVVRPRDNSLVTEVEGEEVRRLWTTFSEDQIDLNYANPEVLVRIIDLLLFYVKKGATIIRLDAIAYLWKKSGTSCIHLEETHRVIRIFRAVLDMVAPHVALITETNVPHEQNISYFGNGKNEAQMVYQFPLPPLVLDAFLRGDARKLSNWARDLEFPSKETTYLNFLASHDGIGVRPAEGILPESSIENMVKKTREHGGEVSYKSDKDGGKSPYELNITYFDALSDPNGDEPLDLQINKFMSSQAIMLGFLGVPGIYFHSLVGSRNWNEGVEKTGRKRTINREKCTLEELEEELNNPNSRRRKVLDQFKTLLSVRKQHKAFHPSASQEVINLSRNTFSFLRRPEGAKKSVLCVHSVSQNSQKVSLDKIRSKLATTDGVVDLISGEKYRKEGSGENTINLAPYEVLWLVEERV